MQSMNEMRRVDELMTGDGLRMLNEVHSKPIYTNHIGGDIFEVTYFETDDEMQEGFEISKEHEVFGQFMTKDETINYLQSADKLGIKIVSARRSNLQLEDSQPLYRVRWIDLNQSQEVSPEELNTGPDTTENINEVHEQDEKHTGYPLGKWPKMTDEELKHIDQSPTVLSREWKEHDPETERINKAMERMKWRNRNNFRDVDVTPERDQPMDSGDVMFGVDQKTLEEVVDESRERGCTYAGTPESDEKIRRAATGFTAEKQTDFPGAAHGEQWLRESEIRESGDVMFGVDYETQGLQGNVDPLMSREFLERYREPIVLGPDPIITPGAETYDDIISKEQLKESMEKSRQAERALGVKEDLPFPGEVDANPYAYSNILKSMDETHTRKNSDYGDAAYKGYKKYGDYYFLVQLHNKLTRLENLTVNNKSQQVKEESIDDSLLDMANYAVMYLESRHRND